jgi:alpha-beta hydrolase superfamily lysophospholipase
LADVIPWKFTAGDGYRWFYRHFPAHGKAVARVVGIHGIQSHGGWYEASSRYLRDAGCDVYFVDRRGSGQNQECRGDAPSFRRLIDDLGEFLQSLRGMDQPPLYVSSISWGGKIGAGLCYRFPGLIDGLILFAPGFKPRVSPPRAERMKIIAAAVRSPTKMFPIPLNDPTLFTANVERQEFIRKDPLALREATARFLVESAKFDVYLRRAPKHVTPPVLLLLAGEDRVIDNDRTRQYAARFATRDLTVNEYPAAHHTLEFEPSPEPIFADVTKWILDRSRS